jgi:hypothetical protein
MTEEPVGEPGEEPAAVDRPSQETGDVTDGPTGGATGDLEASTGDPDQVRTGVERVDAVVADVAGLADRPVEEHAAVYESAHERLRRTLDDPDPES